MKYLAEVYPDAALLPDADTPLTRLEINSLLGTFSADMHPQLPLMRFPFLFTQVAEAHEGLGDLAANRLRPKLVAFNAGLAQQDWLLGDKWSIIERICVESGSALSAAKVPMMNFRRSMP